jgi:hypothetical protein
MQAALDSISGGGQLYIPIGTYSIATMLTSYSGVTIEGAGQDVTILSYTGASSALALTNLTKCTVRDLALVNTASSTSCLTMQGSTLCTIQSVRLTGSVAPCVGVFVKSGNENIFINVAANLNGQDGFYFDNNANNCTLIGCEAVGNTRAGLYSLGPRQLACYSCAFEGSVAVPQAYGVYITTGTTGTIRTVGLLLSNCYIEGSGTFDVYCITGGGSLYPRGISIKDCYFVKIATLATTAIRIEDIDGIEIDGCTFDDIGGAYTASCVVNNAGSINGVVWGFNTDKSTQAVTTTPGTGITVVAGKTYHDMTKADARAWANVRISTGAIDAAGSRYYQCSVVRNSAGVYTVTLASAMTGLDWCILANCEVDSATAMLCQADLPTSTTSCIVRTYNVAGVPTEARSIRFIVYN